MLNHDQLCEQWEKDCKVDTSQLSHTLASHPLLHSKYLTILQTYKVALRKHVIKYQKMKILKQRYYNGELTKEELDANGWKQYLNKRPLRGEMETLLDGDPDLQNIQEQSVYLEMLVTSTESIMKEISNRTFLYRSMVDYQKFLSGA
jgi:hypothetical protein